MKILSLRKLGLAALVFLLVLAIMLAFRISNLKLVSSDEFNSSVSSFISIEGSDEYVIATLRSGEILSKQIFNKAIFDLPIGDTEAVISVTANYKYFIRLSRVQHRLVGDTLYIDVPDLELSLPVGFDIRSMSESSNKTGFGPKEDILKRELRVEMAMQLQTNGERQKASVYDHGAKSIADNFNKYLNKNGLSGMYNKIVVSFDGVRSDVSVRRTYEYSARNCEHILCGENWRVGDYHIFLPREKSFNEH